MSSTVKSTDCLETRRAQVRESEYVSGLDFVHVCAEKNADALPKLDVFFLGKKPDWITTGESFRLTKCDSGVRLPVEIVAGESKAPDKISLRTTAPVKLDSRYQLSLVVPEHAAPSIDRFFNELIFRFDPHTPSAVDCAAPRRESPSDSKTESPAISYLAKDYRTFRQLILDRMATTLPDWQDRCPADIGIMLVEILAYSADHLSYFQDAVATESYLSTARLRPSLRRHCRLIDYRVHEGCNARVWLHLNVDRDVEVSNSGTLFFAAHPNPSGKPLPPDALEKLVADHPNVAVFEPVVSKSFTFRVSHNECRIHDWSGATPCLRKGATSAFLVNQNLHSKAASRPSARNDGAERPDKHDWLQFQPGDVVLLEQIRDPWTGCTADADPARRHVVRITSVDYQQCDDLVRDENDQPLPLVKIEWDEADALPFTLWLCRPPDASWLCDEDTLPAVARGNMLLADHGRSIKKEKVSLRRSWSVPDRPGSDHYPEPNVLGKLTASHLTYSDSLPPSGAPAVYQTIQDPRRATPRVILQSVSGYRDVSSEFSMIELSDTRRVASRLLSRLVAQMQNAPSASSSTNANVSTSIKTSLARAARRVEYVVDKTATDGESTGTFDISNLSVLGRAIRDDLRDVWLAKYDLIVSESDDAHFVVEMTDDRIASLRFGKHGFGRTPKIEPSQSDHTILADYRVGNGESGNVAAETIETFGTRGSDLPIRSVRNPLPATGGQDPESTDQIRLFAPHSIKSNLQRAITSGDYQSLAMKRFSHWLHNAKVTLRWTGHEFRVLVAIDPLGDERLSDEKLAAIKRFLYRFRRIGHEVHVRHAERVVPIIRMRVCIEPHMIRAQIRQSLDRLFSDQVLPDGKLAFFHPDQMTFGDGLSISQIETAAVGIDGVVDAQVIGLHRADEGPRGELRDSVLRLKPQEIMRFDNDARRPEFGRLELQLEGGR